MTHRSAQDGLREREGMSRLSQAQLRHLSEMVGPDGQSLFWNPHGSEYRTCEVLQRAGLLIAHHSYGVVAYTLSEEGMKVARAIEVAR